MYLQSSSSKFSPGRAILAHSFQAVMAPQPRRQNPQRQPLTVALRKICRDYPPGAGILRELLQNADDAGASTVVFLLSGFIALPLLFHILIRCRNLSWTRAHIRLPRYSSKASRSTRVQRCWHTMMHSSQRKTSSHSRPWVTRRKFRTRLRPENLASDFVQ